MLTIESSLTTEDTMESLAGLIFRFDLAVFALVLIAIPCVLVAVAIRRPSSHQ